MSRGPLRQIVNRPQQMVFVTLSVVCGMIFIFLFFEIMTRTLWGPVLPQHDPSQLYPVVDHVNSIPYKKQLSERLGSHHLFTYIYPQNISIRRPFNTSPDKLRRHYRRILIIGDSVAAGVGLDIRYSYASILAKEFDRVQIIDLAVPGFSIYQVHAIFQHYFRRIEPDLVIYHFHGDDPTPTIFTTFSPSNIYIPYLYTSPSTADFTCTLQHNTVLSRSAFCTLFMIKVPPFFYRSSCRLVSFFERCFLLLIKDMYDTCTHHKSNFMIIFDQNTQRRNRGRAPVLTMLKQHGIKNIYSIPMDNSAYLPDKAHFNAKGHQRFTQQLIPIIRRHLKNK